MQGASRSSDIADAKLVDSSSLDSSLFFLLLGAASAFVLGAHFFDGKADAAGTSRDSSGCLFVC